MNTHRFISKAIFVLLFVTGGLLAQTKVSDLFDISRLPYLKDSMLFQISSNDTTGGNADYVTIKKDQRAVLADIKGAGVISRIWVTISSPDKYFLRRILLRMYWDGEKTPSVEVPAGDFFGTGFEYTHYLSALVGMSSGGYYSYFPMPFSNGARIEAVNETGQDVGSFYYQIDYQQLQSLEPNVGRFHAQWRREPRTEKGKNYTVLEAEGHGQFVGLNLNMQGYREKQLWFLEGDEFIYVDGEKVASVRGTGTEDYFTSGWYFNRGTYAGPYHGLIIKDDTLNSRIVAYRFHIGDQIPFQKSIKVTIEHGHANEELGDYSSVAYWYQAEPHKQFAQILPAQRRIPLRVVVPENAIEAEDLLGSARATGGQLSVQDMASYGVDWGHDKQLQFKAPSSGAEFTI
ncbi:MAG: glycoside hydrolase family 172 protein, partial [Bacteroidota bacterium]